MSLTNAIASHRAEKAKYLISAKRYFTSLALSYNSKQIGKRNYSHNALLRYCEQIDLFFADPLLFSDMKEVAKKYFLYDDDKGKFIISFVNQFFKTINNNKETNFISFPLVK